MLDACRAQNLSAYGYERPTSPNIDALAKRGALFEKNYSQASTTTLSLPSYMSGRFFPVACITGNWGQLNWRQLFRTPPADEKLVTEIFGENGYHTEIVTSHPWFGPETRLVKSADHCVYIPAPGRGHADFELMNQEVFRFLDQRPADKPFFLYMHTMDTHFPHFVRPGHDEWIDKAYAGNPAPTDPMYAKKPENEQDKALLRGLYDGGIHYADAQVQALLDKLAATGLAENTIIVIGSDHGECLGEDGETIEHPPQFNYEELVHVPFIIAGPGIPQGKRISAFSQNADIVPTLVDLLGLKTEARFDGESQVPALRGDATPVLDYAVGRWPRGEDDYLHYVSLRNDAYRYEYHPFYKQGDLWKFPDHVDKREKLPEGSPDAATMRAYIEQNILPKWDAYLALPHDSPRVFSASIAPRQAIPSEGFKWDSTDDDNVWQLQPNILRSVSTKEDCPPIQFKYEVPNGMYQILVELKPKDTGASIQLKAEQDAAFKPITSTAVEKLREFLDIGIYTISDEAFDVTIDDVDRRFNAEVISFLFVPIIDGEPMEYADDLEARNEQLGGLGYMGNTIHEPVQ